MKKRPSAHSHCPWTSCQIATRKTAISPRIITAFLKMTLAAVSTCVVLGYLWRRAEHELVPDKAAFAEIEAAVREDARKGAELAIATLNESNPEHRGLDRYWALYWGAAARSANDMSPANLGSIGGREAGEETLSWAFREMTDYLPRVSRGATDVIRRRAFNFGIHVADVEYVSA